MLAHFQPANPSGPWPDKDEPFWVADPHDAPCGATCASSNTYRKDVHGRPGQPCPRCGIIGQHGLTFEEKHAAEQIARALREGEPERSE
jgi:hypothetical protein